MKFDLFRHRSKDQSKKLTIYCDDILISGKEIDEFNPETGVLGKKAGPRLEKLAWDLLNQVAKCGRRYGIDVKAVSPAAVLRKSQEECSTVDSSIL